MTNEKPFPDAEDPIEEEQTQSHEPVKKEGLGDEVSLLDLMNELDEPDTAVPPAASKPPTDPDEPTQTISPPLAVETDNDATVTDLPAPSKDPSKTPAPLPLTADDLQPKELPPIDDLEATEVQPRVAIPGKERPLADAPTHLYRKETPADEDDAPTIVQRPVRPVRERPQPSAAPPQPPRRPLREQQPPAPQPTEPQPAHTSKVAMPGKKPARPKPHIQTRARRNWRGCFTRAILISILLAVLGVSLLVVGAAIGYTTIANDLPSPRQLETNASQFETAHIYDRNGNELYALSDPNAGNRTRVTLDQISPYLIQATIATEDSRFYENPGFDVIGITRAVIQAAQEREFVSGASTITQQLVRAVLLGEDERTERSFRRKVREIILAAELARTYEKDEILELYLNEIYYGNRAYGIEAAAQTYFGKSAADLTLAEASLLAGLPQAPALWDPYTAPDKALGRQSEVLGRMVAEGYITPQEAQDAINETNLFVYNLEPPETVIKHPHFTLTVLQQAEDLLGAQAIYRGGLRILTTLDPNAQVLAEETVANARPNIVAAGANNAAMVVIKPDTGEILALVGSVDFNDESISGQVNMALAPRQPGSTIKPFVYLAAMEQGWTPATLIWDVPTAFPNGTNPPYVPKNYDDEFHGPLRLRPSLGNSYNVTAVKALEYVGVCAFIDRVQSFGLVSLQDEGCTEQQQPRNYGLALALGGGEIAPLEMATAFATLANQGRNPEPFALARIENRAGDVLYEHVVPNPADSQVVDANLAYLISDILSDNNARQPEFGVNNLLVIPGHRVAAKTGTSGTDRFDVRDAWTIGYTPQVVTAVWVGNTDNQPIGEGQSGYRVAAPIWNTFMTQYLSVRTPVDFTRPSGVVDIEICATSGTRPGPNCSQRIIERFASNHPPLEAEQDFLRIMPVDLWTNLQATEACQESVAEVGFFNLLVSGQDNVLTRERQAAQNWIENTPAGRAWTEQLGVALPLQLPPTETCESVPERPSIVINQPPPGTEITDKVRIEGSVSAPNFAGYQVEFGIGQNPGGWGLVQERQPNPVTNGLLAEWDTSKISTFGPITLRVLIFGPDNPFTPEEDPVSLEERILLTLLEPTPTPTATPTETPMPTLTPTPTETPTITPTPSPTTTPLPSTATPAPTETAVPIETAVPTEQPTAAPTP
ncbi:MAG: hypothetical protein Kow0080_20840 [Candidatus Promineifilaceae bacterium]